jgi:Ca-activated chloride channel family protein
MTRKAPAAVFVAVLLVVPNILAQNGNPSPGAPPETVKAAPSATPKLSRRDRKERISKLSDQYRRFLEDVAPIIQPEEVDTFLILETDAQRELYINDFWRRRDAAQGTTNLSFKDQYYGRLETVRDEFKQVSSDRSRIFLIHGEPEGRLKIDCNRYLQPLEIWKYFYVPGLGHSVRFLFYIPRNGNDYRLWQPIGDTHRDLGELISSEAAGGAMTTQAAVNSVFFASEMSRTFVSKIQFGCKDGDEILRAIAQVQQNKIEMTRVFEPPKMNTEDAGRILRSVVIATPNAPKLTASLATRFPARQGRKTDAEITVLLPREQLTAKEVGGTSMYSIDVTGEVLRAEQLYENYRYRFDFPGDMKDENLPIVLDRFLRPGDYKSRIKVVDVHSGAEAILENDLTVPEIADTPEQRKQKEAAAAAVAELKDDIDSGETRLRIIPLADELHSGIQKIETLAVGDAIKSVEFYLDGKKIAIKRQPPFTLDLDFGDVPQVRKIKAVALNDKGQPIAGDDIIINTGNDPFRVRIVSPRLALNVKGPTRVEVSVKAPEGKSVGEVQVYLNETRVATLYNAPYVQTVNIPPTQGVGYLRAVALLKDDPSPPVEDIVMINTPEFMEEVEVHLVELPTTVIANGRPVTDLSETAFKVLDEGKPVKISKFEYVKNLPLSIGMAIDTSGSMQPRMNEAQKAAAQFFQRVMKPGDKGFLVGFDSTPQLVQKWSRELSDVHASLAKLRAEEYTALYDAIVYSLYNFLGVKGQKALIVLSDGKDTASKFAYDQALEYARRAAVPIYVIGIGIRTTEVDVRYKLGKFANETGGAAYYIDRAEDLAKIYDDIQNELRSQYLLGFYPPDGVKSGSKWREVTVQVAQGKAKTIRGYYP